MASKVTQAQPHDADPASNERGLGNELEILLGVEQQIVEIGSVSFACGELVMMQIARIRGKVQPLGSALSKIAAIFQAENQGTDIDRMKDVLMVLDEADIYRIYEIVAIATNVTQSDVAALTIPQFVHVVRALVTANWKSIEKKLIPMFQAGEPSATGKSRKPNVAAGST